MIMGTQGPRGASSGFSAMMEEAEEKTEKYYKQNWALLLLGYSVFIKHVLHYALERSLSIISL